MANASDAHLFQLLMLERDQSLSDNLVLYTEIRQDLRNTNSIATLPVKSDRYCRSPRLATKSAHSSAVHSVMIVRGGTYSSRSCPYVVGVCSVDRESVSVGEASESVGSCGDAATLRSYSSSASESSWYCVWNDMVAGFSSAAGVGRRGLILFVWTGGSGVYQVRGNSPTICFEIDRVRRRTQMDDDERGRQKNR